MRTVVAFERLGPDTVVKLADAENDVPGLGDNAMIDVTPLAGGNAMQRGEALLARLAAHPPVKAGIDQVLSHPPGAAPSPLYFHMLASSADELPWEQLYVAPVGFCTLDRRWPVGRIAYRKRTVTDRAFDPPLRIVAVLSAAGQSGAAQLQALLAATAKADAAAVGVRLHVITADEAVTSALAKAGRPDVTVQVLGDTAVDLARQIADAQPQILHVLCHGGAVAGVRTLAFATIADFDAGEATGSVRLKLADLVASVLSADPWLVVLNACDSAEAVEGSALAHELASSGLPAVVGMRRLVDVTDADRFCAALYPEVFAAVRAAVDPAGQPGVRTIDWAAVLTTPRGTLTGPDPSAVDTWSDPVLYVQYDAFRVFAPTPTLSSEDYSGIRGELDLWEGYLESVEARELDPAVRAEVEAKVATLRGVLADAGV